jgi:hypothetical protein
MSVKRLQGGSGQSPTIGPAIAARGYKTSGNGMAATVAPAAGEVAVIIERGDARHFSDWVIGPIDEVCEYLTSHAATLESDDSSYTYPVGHFAAVVERIRRAAVPTTPAACLAQALGLSHCRAEDISRAARIAGVRIERETL